MTNSQLTKLIIAVWTFTASPTLAQVGDFGQQEYETSLKQQLGFDEHKIENTETLVRKLTATLAANPDDRYIRLTLFQAHIRYGDMLRESDEKKAISEYRAALAIVDVEEPTQEAVDKRDYQPEGTGLYEAEVNRLESTVHNLKKRARKSLKELTKGSSPHLGHPWPSGSVTVHPCSPSSGSGRASSIAPLPALGNGLRGTPEA